jgi:hypothetical protein
MPYDTTPQTLMSVDANRAEVFATCPDAWVTMTYFGGMKFVAISVVTPTGDHKVGSGGVEHEAWDQAARRLRDPEYRKAIGLNA